MLVWEKEWQEKRPPAPNPDITLSKEEGEKIVKEVKAAHTDDAQPLTQEGWPAFSTLPESVTSEWGENAEAAYREVQKTFDGIEQRMPEETREEINEMVSGFSEGLATKIMAQAGIPNRGDSIGMLAAVSSLNEKLTAE